MSDEADELITVTFKLLDTNYERLWTAAALQGDSRTDTLNRAISLYDEIHRLEAPKPVRRGFFRVGRQIATLGWETKDGTPIRIARIE